MDSSDMTPMRIVSSDDSERLPVCFRHRVSVFVSGAVATLMMVFVILSFIPPPDARSPPVPPPLWTSQINLTETEVYKFRMFERVLSNVSVATHNQTDQYTESQLIRKMYTIEKLCGLNDWSFLRFLISDLEIDSSQEDNSWALELIQRLLNRPALRPPSAKDTHAQTFSILTALSTALTNHTFAARLMHDGGVCETELANVDATVNTASREYSVRALDALVNAFSKDGDASTAREAIAASFQDNVRDVGRKMLQGLYSGVFPFLSSRPKASKQFTTGGSWTRNQTDDDLLQLPVHYVFETLSKGQRMKALWDPKDEMQPPTFVQCEANATDRACAYKSKDKDFLLVRLDSNYRSLDAAGAFLTTNFPSVLEKSMTFSKADVKMRIVGGLVVGAQTGVVLQGFQTMESNSTATLRLNRHVVPPGRKKTSSKESTDHPAPETLWKRVHTALRGPPGTVRAAHHLAASEALTALLHQHDPSVHSVQLQAIDKSTGTAKVTVHWKKLVQVLGDVQEISQPVCSATN